MWLRATALSEAFRAPEAWLWPLFESIHFLGLALVLGVAGFFDLRLLGFMKRIPVWKAAELLPLAMIGVALNVVTGFYFYVAEPFQVLVQHRVVVQGHSHRAGGRQRGLLSTRAEIPDGGSPRRRRHADLGTRSSAPYRSLRGSTSCSGAACFRTGIRPAGGPGCSPRQLDAPGSRTYPSFRRRPYVDESTHDRVGCDVDRAHRNG